MNFKRYINKNAELIKKVIITIVVGLLCIKALNYLYEIDEKNKQIQAAESAKNNQDDLSQMITEEDYTTESNSVEITMGSFVNYCNKREIENAYKMLTEECKEAMFPTVEDFERIYINNIYNVKREYELTKWSIDGNKATYLVVLYGDILATGNTENFTQEYYTFVEDEQGNYKLNVNNYIYRENRNAEITSQNITVKIEHVDVYEQYEEITFKVTNKTGRKISLTGNKYNEKIYLQNNSGISYSPLTNEFDNQEIVIDPSNSKTFTVRFNKLYNSTNKATKMILSDIILDYDTYLKTEDKNEYSNRTSIKMQYRY